MDRRGTSLIEIVVALLVLSVGVLAYTGSAALATRLIAQGRIETVAARLATSRVERLTDWARVGSPACRDPRFASGSSASATLSERWRVEPNGPLRAWEVVVEYPGPRGPQGDTLAGAIQCGP